MDILLGIALLLIVAGSLYLVILLIKATSLKVSELRTVKSTVDFTFSSISTFLNTKLFGSLFLLGGFCIWIYQIYSWLKYAEWKSFSLLWPFSLSTDYQSWVFYPYEWVGVHRILDFIPLSIVLILVGVAFFYPYQEQIKKAVSKE